MDEKLPLSVAIITLNEEANLPRCLAAVHELAAEIVIVDCGSTDRTPEIAREFGAIFIHHPWQGFVAQKNVSFDCCTQPWVLGLDADEVVSPELAKSIRELFQNGEPPLDGYEVNRRQFYLGRWIWHAWYPEWKLRLVRRGVTRWTGVEPHANLEALGLSGRLQGDLLHYSYVDLHDHLQRTIKYSRIMAESLAGVGRRFRWHDLIIRPWLDFLKRLILKRAWRDGWRGWVLLHDHVRHIHEIRLPA